MHISVFGNVVHKVLNSRVFVVSDEKDWREDAPHLKQVVWTRPSFENHGWTSFLLLKQTFRFYKLVKMETSAWSHRGLCALLQTARQRFKHESIHQLLFVQKIKSKGRGVHKAQMIYGGKSANYLFIDDVNKRFLINTNDSVVSFHMLPYVSRHHFTTQK